MSSNWPGFLDEVQKMIHDSTMNDLINVEVINDAIYKIGNKPQPDIIFKDEFKILTRSLILYRFINSF